MSVNVLEALDIPEVEEISQDLADLKSDDAMLVVRRGSNVGSRFVLDDEITSIGRHPNNAIFLDDVTVSRKHAEFVRHRGDFVVRDLGSMNGTYVNGERVDSAPLKNGDEIQVGAFKLLFFAGQS